MFRPVQRRPAGGRCFPPAGRSGPRFGGGARRPAVGAPALILHAVALTVIGLDWILALEPPFRSTAFGLWLGVTQLLAALAWCALLEPEPGGKRAADLAGLLLACALGAAYLGFAQYLVAWYGNLKPRADWYLPRQEMPWLLVEVVSIAASAVLPVVAMLPGVLRCRSRMRRVAPRPRRATLTGRQRRRARRRRSRRRRKSQN